MSNKFDLTITISSYNRDDKVLETLHRLFESDFSGFQKIELIVVDDGSPRPVENVLPQLGEIPPVIEMRMIRQENSGIGATRNRGFRESKANLVLFLDDDILLEKDTIQKIFKAHRENHGAVIFGSYPFITHESPALEKFARGLFGYNEITATEKFESVKAITSGLLCVDKSKLHGIEDFYQNDLTIPAAEEYEIVYRFHRLGIPIVHAKHIHAIHNHHLELAWLVEQQFKYGLGTAEAFSKYPEIEKLSGFDGLKKKLQAIKNSSGKDRLKSLMSSNFGRKTLFLMTKMLERNLPNNDHNFLFGLLTSAYYWAGYLEGARRFSSDH